MICANIFDFIDGKVAYITGTQSEFGAFWDSTLDRFSDLALFTGLICLYSKLGRTDYVLVAALTLIFSIMTSYARARAEWLIEKCKVGFMERPERIVLFMIGAFTNRMAGGAVGDSGAVDPVGRQPDPLHVSGAQQAADAVDDAGCAAAFNRAFFWRDERTTIPYDLWVIAILAFVWLTPPDWLNDPVAAGQPGLLQWILSKI